MRRQRSIWTTGLVLPKVKPCMANQASWSAPWRLAGLRLALTLTAPWSHQGAAVRSSALSWRWEPIRRGSRWNDIIISQVVLLQTHRPQRAAGGSAADASPTEGSRWFCCRRMAHRGQRVVLLQTLRPQRAAGGSAADASPTEGSGCSGSDAAVHPDCCYHGDLRFRF
ncbi:uncharacterized protein LOC119776801 isoform X10 [Cyprinodon tularosa]|uniref:uncharacterized protein LOC119776801 isoform X10 n=1 Tax=Cyprinodon tularosa TaxID=77115 RepID=UPI0018E27AF5|nr:uncharacterized protein LOC119776801 isoform X10 [Cyprinodon tularosa]